MDLIKTYSGKNDASVDVSDYEVLYLMLSNTAVSRKANEIIELSVLQFDTYGTVPQYAIAID